MTRGLLGAVALVAAGCATGPKFYTPPADVVPDAIDHGGAQVVILDRRPDWERKPFTAAISLYHLGRVTPNPWDQLARETEAVVDRMPEKPERVTVTVTAFRLVKRDDPELAAENASVRPPDRTDFAGPKAQQRYEEAKAATAAGVQDAARPVATDLTAQPLLGWGLYSLLGARPEDRYPAGVLDHPPGASCELQTQVLFVFPGGREQAVTTRSIGAGGNQTGSKYWGEALGFAVNWAVRDYGRKVRVGVGLPEEP